MHLSSWLWNSKDLDLNKQTAFGSQPVRADTQSNTSRPTWDPTVPTEDKGISQIHSTFSAKYVLSLFLILLKTSGLIMIRYLIDYL